MFKGVGRMQDTRIDEKSDVNDKWYVIQTVSSEENKVIDYISKYENQTDNEGKTVVKDCFVPKRELRKKIKGEWRTVTERIFPGYIFMVTDDPEKLFYLLKDVPRMTKLLGRDKDGFIELKSSEVDFISRIGNDRKDHTIKMSKIGFDENDKVILSGDLSTMNGYIKKIDKHRRQAIVEVEMFGRKTEIYAGFEFMKKL